jgi:hypothetical protein
MTASSAHGSDRGKLFILLAICLSARVLPLSFTGDTDPLDQRFVLSALETGLNTMR